MRHGKGVCIASSVRSVLGVAVMVKYFNVIYYMCESSYVHNIPFILPSCLYSLLLCSLLLSPDLAESAKEVCVACVDVDIL
jgi:hypothetical protein